MRNAKSRCNLTIRYNYRALDRPAITVSYGVRALIDNWLEEKECELCPGDDAIIDEASIFDLYDHEWRLIVDGYYNFTFGHMMKYLCRTLILQSRNRM